MKRNKIIKKTLGTTIGGALFVGATTIGVSCACAKIEDEGQEIISASSEGDLKRGAKVNVKLYGKLKWSSITLTGADGWEKVVGEHSFFKQNVNAISDDNIIIKGGNASNIKLTVSSGSSSTSNAPMISASVTGNIRSGAIISITLINGANWNDVNISYGTDWSKGLSEFTKTDPSATNDENVIVQLVDGNSISVNVPSGYTPTPNAPAMSASMTGNLNTMVTISVNLYNDAAWDDVTIISDNTWTKNLNQTFTRTDVNATNDEQVSIVLSSSGVNLTFNVPCGYIPPLATPAISASVLNNIRSGAVISVQLINGANWNDVNLIGSTQGTWTKNDDQTFTKTDTQASVDESLIVNLTSASSMVIITVPSGQTPAVSLPTMSASVNGNLINGSIINISLFNGAVWSDVQMTTSGGGWTRDDTYHRFTKTNPSAVVDELVILTLTGGNVISLMIPSGIQPPAPTPQISASISGNIRTGATISINLINNAVWSNVVLSGPTSLSWTRNDGVNTYTKTDATATSDENLTIQIAGGNTIFLVAPSGYTPARSISASISGNLIIGATITVALYNNANWSDVNLIGSDTGFWTKNDNQTFTRTNTDAVDSEAIIVSLSGGNAIALSIPTAYTNHLTTLNGSRYTIDVNYNDFLSSQTSDGDQDSNFNFRDLKGTDHSIIKKNILTISIRDLPQIEVTPARYFAYLCYYFVNLIRVDIVFPSTIKTWSNATFLGTFMYCKSLTLASFNSDFSVIHSQGEHTININGNGSYMKHMFAYCTELNYLPANFTTPIFRYSGTPNTIYDGIFWNCVKLVKLPSNFTVSIDDSVNTNMGNSFCFWMFRYCKSLIGLPPNFMNITRLETAGLSVGDYFFNLMFEECTSLNNDAPDAQTFHIPNLTSTVGFCNQMFIGTIFAPPNTPNRGSDYLINTAFN